MDKKIAAILPSILFAFAGLAFMVAAYLGERLSFVAVGLMFVGLAFVFYAISKKKQAGEK